MQFTQNRFFNWNRHISTSIDPRRFYKGSNWIFGCLLFIETCLRFLFYIWSREFQKNSNFVKIKQKWQYFMKSRIFVGSMPKLIGFQRKYILIFLQNLKAIGAVSIELSRKQKLTIYTHTHTYIHFRQTNFFFQCRSYICKKKSKFDDWFLTPIQGFT